MRRQTSSPPSAPVLDAGLRLLGRCAHSMAELRQKLERRGYKPDEVAGALARLRELGYLDDEAYARGLVSRRSGTRGRRAIAAELAQRGVDREVARTVMAGLEVGTELAAAERIARRLWAAQGDRGEGAPDRRALERIGAGLLRRGFSHEVAAAASARLKALAVISEDC